MRKASRTPTSSGASTASGSTGSSPTPRSRTPPSKARCRSSGSRTGVTNVSYNCIDRHLKKRGDQVAIIWEGDNPYVDKKITYNELYEHVCRLANVLKKHGVKKGDRVTIYMPMIPEAAYAMLACTRIGAIHSVVFGGFSPDALAGRIVDCESTFVITADEGLRGGKPIPLKDNTDKAIDIARQAPCDGRKGAGRAPHRRQDRLGDRAATSGTTRRSRR